MPTELLNIYANWQHRLVDVTPRRLHESAVVRSHEVLRSDPALSAYSKIKDDIVSGRSLHRYLSRRIEVGFERPSTRGKRLTRRRDLDMLLNDWGLHHLHLSTNVEPDGFVGRSASVVVAAFVKSDAYIVDVISHGEWTSGYLIETIVREWPDSGLVWRLDVLPDEKELTSEERKTLRDAGVSGYVRVDGKVYLAGAGYSSSGHSTTAAMAAMQAMRNVTWFAQETTADPLFVHGHMVRAGFPVPALLDLHFAFLPTGGYGIVDRTSGFTFTFPT